MNDYALKAHKYLVDALLNGQNILLTGQFALCWQWAVAALKYHHAAVRAPAEKLPERWRQVTVNNVVEIAKERLFIDFSADFASIPTIATATAGALLWLPAATISQALIRYELFSGAENSMMLVPAGLSAVAIVKNDGRAPYIAEVDTINLADTVYKPCPLLFDSPLEPEAPPKRAAAAPLITEPAAPTPLNTQAAAIAETLAEFEELAADELPEEDEDFAGDDDLTEEEGNFDPGWELDMLMASGAVAPSQSIESADASDMAASYRLGPPPKPLSMIDAERAAKPGNVVLPPPPVTPATEAVKDSFERQFGPGANSGQTSTANPRANLPRSFQAVLAERQKRR